MDSTAYDKTDELENRYWWYIGRRYVFDKLLSRLYTRGTHSVIADIGCGTGGNIPTLQKYGKVVGMDISPKALEYCQSKGFTNTHLMPSEIPRTGLNNESVDLITMFDVLEHFKDDEAALQEYYRVLKPGGMFFLTVPAFKLLWSELDEHLHHFRRYKRGELETKLRHAGFEIITSSYLFFFTFPLVFFYRVIGNFQEKKFHPQFKYVEFPKIINWMLVSFSKVEAFLLRGMTLPFGSSVICLAQKPDVNSEKPHKNIDA